MRTLVKMGQTKLLKEGIGNLGRMAVSGRKHISGWPHFEITGGINWDCRFHLSLEQAKRLLLELSEWIAEVETNSKK